MRRIAFLLSFFILSSTVANAQIEWKESANGLQTASLQAELFNSSQSVSAVRFKCSKHKLKVVNETGKHADSTSALALSAHAIAAVNGSYFDMRHLTPTTYIKEKGVVEGHTTQPETGRCDGVVAAKGKKIDILLKNTYMEEDGFEKYRHVMAAGPVLLLEGKPARESWPQDGGFYSARHPRAIVGTDAQGWGYLIVIDGRFRTQAAGASIPEAMEIALMFGLQNAINLDGGGSCALWTKNDGVLSHPSDNRSFDNYGQRRVPNILIVK